MYAASTTAVRAIRAEHDLRLTEVRRWSLRRRREPARPVFTPPTPVVDPAEHVVRAA